MTIEIIKLQITFSRLHNMENQSRRNYTGLKFCNKTTHNTHTHTYGALLIDKKGSLRKTDGGLPAIFTSTIKGLKESSGEIEGRN